MPKKNEEVQRSTTQPAIPLGLSGANQHWTAHTTEQLPRIIQPLRTNLSFPSIRLFSWTFSAESSSTKFHVMSIQVARDSWMNLLHKSPHANGRVNILHILVTMNFDLSPSHSHYVKSYYDISQKSTTKLHSSNTKSGSSPAGFVSESLRHPQAHCHCNFRAAAMRCWCRLCKAAGAENPSALRRRFPLSTAEWHSRSLNLQLKRREGQQWLQRASDESLSNAHFIHGLKGRGRRAPGTWAPKAVGPAKSCCRAATQEVQNSRKAQAVRCQNFTRDSKQNSVLPCRSFYCVSYRQFMKNYCCQQMQQSVCTG